MPTFKDIGPLPDLHSVSEEQYFSPTLFCHLSPRLQSAYFCEILGLGGVTSFAHQCPIPFSISAQFPQNSKWGPCKSLKLRPGVDPRGISMKFCILIKFPAGLSFSPLLPGQHGLALILKWFSSEVQTEVKATEIKSNLYWVVLTTS